MCLNLIYNGTYSRERVVQHGSIVLLVLKIKKVHEGNVVQPRFYFTTLVVAFSGATIAVERVYSD